jgi:site-specific recombinase XerD
MTLGEAIDRYITWKRAGGARFESVARVLRQYARSVGEEVGCGDARRDQVRAFLGGNAPLTAYRGVKRSALAGFYRYALARGLATRSPLPTEEPPRPPSAPPYIYTREELRRLLDGVASSRQQAWQLEARTFRALLLLLYGAGLRHGEARRLTQADVDLPNALLTVRDSKFRKTRLVPLGAQLAQALARHAAGRADTAPFFANRDGTPLCASTVRDAFAALREATGVRRPPTARYQPRLHDLRHAFAVHRLTAWYRQGADVQRLLPLLSTYLGHASVASTQVYLTMTPELLRAASLRFQRYAGSWGGRDD